MKSAAAALLLFAGIVLAGCSTGDESPTTTAQAPRTDGPVRVQLPAPGSGGAAYGYYTLPAVFTGPIGLYEPTIDVGDDGAIYVSAHSTEVGRNPAPAYVSMDDGVTWESMALVANQQGGPDEQGSAPFLSDEVFIVAGDDGQAWGADCCFNAHMPLVGWCDNGATVCAYNQNGFDNTQFVADAPQGCVPFPGTDRPWLAYANGKLLLVNNPGGSLVSPSSGPIAVQVGAMDVPPLIPFAYTGSLWLIDWNLCASTGGFIPGIPDMRDDHFFAVPQWVGFNGPCQGESQYDVVVGNAADVSVVKQVTAFRNSHVPPAEADSSPSQIGLYGQAVFDGNGALYVGAMNNTAADQADCEAHPKDGGIHLALSTDDAATFKETTFRFDAPVSAFYMDGNKKGSGALLTWGLIDGNNTDWYAGHLLPNADGTLRLENVMLAVDDGPEASRHVQGASLGPDGRAYLALSMNSQNPGGATSSPGDTPLRVAVQLDGPAMAATASA